MNKVLIVDASESDRRLMSGLLVKRGYESIAVENMEAAKEDVAKLPPGAVIMADHKLPDGSAKKLAIWQKEEGFSFPVITIVNNLNGADLLEVLSDGAALVGKHDPTSDRNEMYNRIEGYFQEAKSGTLIVKNIQLLTFEKQSVLLHILEREHQDVRIICTANSSLLKMVADETFRDNLFFILRQMGTWRGVAKLLCISERALLDLRKKHGINSEGATEGWQHRKNA